mgnify:CR=1 FL=1
MQIELITCTYLCIHEQMWQIGEGEVRDACLADANTRIEKNEVFQSKCKDRHGGELINHRDNKINDEYLPENIGVKIEC